MAGLSWVDSPSLRFVVGFVVAISYTVGIVFLLLRVFEWIFKLDIGDSLYGTLYFSVGITIVISLFMEGRAFLNNWRKAALDAERLQKENARAQYEALKNQVNPHFLFNSLNALTQLVYEDQDKAATFIKQLSEVYRYVLDTREKELVTIDEELSFIRSYLFLQQIRFGQKLQISILVDSKDTLLPPLALQILVENAIKHNIISEEHPLHVRIYSESGFLIVTNNLQKKLTLDVETSGVGLANIRRRYEFLTKEQIVVTEKDNQFTVKLPFLKEGGKS